MNRAFRLVWNDALGAFVAVAEHVGGRGKGRSGASRAVAGAVMAGAALSAFAQQAPPAPTALPQGGVVTQGQAQLQQSGARLDVNQTTGKAAINWQSFDIGAQAQVNFKQPDAKSVALNRVVGSDVSQIFGKLTSNGQVMLVNPNGIVFGKGAQVDVGGLVASTLHLADEDFMAGRSRFTRGAVAGAVVNQGSLSAAAAGYVALLAPEVRNEGVISARLGTVALAGGDAVTLNFDGAQLLGVKVEAATIQTLIDNRQAIVADGGQVILAAGAARQLQQQAVAGGSSAARMVEQDGVVRLVNNSGSISAQGGSVQLSGGNLDLGGSIAARDGGRISVQGDYVGQSGKLDVSSTQGAGGAVKIQAETIIQTAQAGIAADGATRGGSIAVTGSTGADSRSIIYSSGTLSAQASAGQGGHVDLTAGSVQLRAATLDASGSTLGGRVRVGGGFQGGEADIGHATDVGVNASTTLRADAKGAHGDGGQVVVWSDNKTLFAGALSARGGMQTGAGGQAEVSGKQDLVFQGQADLSSRDGRPGQLLLDPRNIIIDNAGSSLASLDLADPTASATSGFGTFTHVLGNGNVIITAPKADTGGTTATGAVYLFNSQSGALLANLRGSNAGDEAGGGGVKVLGNDNYLVLSPKYGTVSGVNTFSLTVTDPFNVVAPSAYAIQSNTTASAGAITWQSAAGSGSAAIGSGNSLLGSTANTDSVTRYVYAGETVNTSGSVTITANDRLGSVTTYDVYGGVAVEGTTKLVELTDGNVAIAAGNWFNGRGAVAWMNGSTGALANAAAGGAVSASTALVGSTGIRSQAPSDIDSNSKQVYVVGLSSSLPFINKDSGNNNLRTAPPGASGDAVGSTLTALPGGSYAVSSPTFTNGANIYAGAATYGAAGGTVGAVSSSNSLVGTHSYDFVASGGVQSVGGGQGYVVASPYWADSGNATVGRFLENSPNGAVTWVDGSTGNIFGSSATGGAVGSGNSLIGGVGDLLGSVSNSATSPISTRIYSGSDTTSLRAIASSTGVKVLKNGNYLVVDNDWNTGRGAVAFAAGATGLAGSVSASNALVGATAGDGVGTGVAELSGSHYIVLAPNADVGAVDGGAAVRGSGTVGITGALSTNNSLYGTTASSRVGSGGVLPVGTLDGDGLRPNALVLSPDWGNRSSATSTVSYGAVTWLAGSTGYATGQNAVGGAVSSSNSLVGDHAGDYVGSLHYADQRSVASTNDSSNLQKVMGDWNAVLSATVDLLANGDFLVRSPGWDGGKGAITWGDGSAGLAGTISSSNSLVGSVADVFSTSSANATRGGISFTDTTYRLTTTGDHLGLLGQTLDNGNYIAISPYWNGGRGAITWVGSGNRTGVVSASNSLVGSTPDTYSDVNQSAITAAGDRLGTLPNTNWVVPVISDATVGGDPVTTASIRPTGPYSFGTSSDVKTGQFYVGGANITLGKSFSVTPARSLAIEESYDYLYTGFTYNGTPIVQRLSNGNVLVASPGWNNTGATQAGAVSWFNGSTGALAGGGSGGTLSAANSLVGSHASDLLGYRLPLDGVTQLTNGNFVLLNPQWWDERGAVTWGSGTAGITGTVDGSNSLVGTTGSAGFGFTVPNDYIYQIVRGDVLVNDWTIRTSDNTGDRVGAGGVVALADGNAVIGSPLWQQTSAWTRTDAPTSLGAATWLNGSNGQLRTGAAGGSINSSNSLVGTQAGDAIGYNAWVDPGTGLHYLLSGITALDGGRHVIASPWWSNGATTGVGAVTFAPAGGIAGTVTAANSLTGATAGDHVGRSLSSYDFATYGAVIDPGVVVLRSGGTTSYMVRSVDWTSVYGNGSGTPAAGAGAATWVNASNGHAYGETGVGAVVSDTNSLTGSSAGDAVSGQSITLKRNVSGNLVATGDLLLLSNLAYCGIDGAGAVTLFSGAHGAAGPVSWRNSLIGAASAADGLATTASDGYSFFTDVRATLLPAAVTGAEQVAWRPLVWVAPNTTSGNNASHAYGLTLVADNSATPTTVDQVNGSGGNSNWGGSLFAGTTGGLNTVGFSGGTLGFSANTGADVVITPAALTALLNAGTSVTLQASNDITVLRDINVSAIGTGGNLKLEAGRSVHLRANIDTDGGNFTAIANQSVANGVVDNDCSTCTAVISQAAGTSVDVGGGHLWMDLRNSTDKTSNDAGTVRLSNLSGLFVQVKNNGVDSGSLGRGIRFNSGAHLGGGVTDRIELYAGGHSAVGGGLVLASDTQLSGSGTLQVSAADLAAGMTLGAASGTGMSMTTAEVGAVIHQSSGFDKVQLGSDSQGGAMVVNSLDFTQASMLRGASTLDAHLQITGGSGGMNVNGVLKSGAANGRDLELFVYDGTIALGASSAVTASTGNLLFSLDAGNLTQASGSTVNAARMRFGYDGTATLTAGTNTVGNVAGNLGSLDLKTNGSTAVDSSGLTANNGITLHASGASADLTLDGTVTSNNANIVLAAGRNFVNNKAANTGLSAPNGRYLVYSTTPTDTTEGMTGYSKHYAQSYAAGATPGYAASGSWFLYSTAPTLTVSVGAGSTIDYGTAGAVPGVNVAGFIDGDTQGSATTGALNFSTSSYTPSGAGFIPAGTYTVTLNGQGTFAADLGYQVNVTPGSSNFVVNPKAINVTGLSAAGKVYDGTTTAQVTGTGAIASGGATFNDGKALSGDTVSLSGTGAGAFADRHAGTGKSVTLSGLTLGGADAGNYTISAGSVTADITPKALDVSGLSVAASKAYDGNTAATPTGSGALLASQTAGAGSTADGKPYSLDTVSLTGTATATYDSAQVLLASQVQFGGLTLTGAQSGNYTLSFGTQAATISPKALTVTGTSVASRVYDGGLLAALSGGTLQGVVGGDTVTLTQAGSFLDKNAGTAKPVTAANSIGGGSASNYSLTQPTGLTADITPKALTVTGSVAAAKVYDGTVTAVISSGSLVGLVGGDTVTLTQAGSFADKNAGIAKAVTIADTLGGGDAGNYTITQPTGLTADITPKAITVTGSAVANKVYDGSTTAAITGGSLQGLVFGDTVTLAQAGSFADKNAGIARTVTIADTLGGGDAVNYTITQPGTLTADITPKAITVTGTTVAAKVYDGSTTAALTGGSLQGLVGGDTVTLAESGHYADKNVGATKAVTATSTLGGGDAGNYALTQPTGLTGTVTPKTITVIGTAVADKVYDGSTAATLVGGSLDGLVNGDTVMLTQAGSFADKNAGTSKVVTAADFLGGADAGNYALTQPTNLTGSVTPKTITVSGTVVADKVYDGTTIASLSGGSLSGLVNGDTVTLAESGQFTDKNAGAAKTVIATGTLSGGDAGNYQLTQPANLTAAVAPKTITVTGTTVVDKVYDGSTAAALTGGTLQGLVGGDSVSLTQAGMFADKNAGSNKSVTAADVLGGADAGNYSLTQPTNLSGSVTPKSVTVTGTVVAEKVYDGSTAATLVGGSLDGLVTGDTVTLTQAGAFADKNVGAGKAVTAANSLGGGDAANYALTQPANLTGSVTPKVITVSGTTVADKVYDGTTHASLSGGSLSGLVGGDTVTLAQSGQFADKNAAAVKTVTATDTLGGIDAGNYQLTQPANLTAAVTPKTITVTGTTVVDKVYDGSTAAALTGGMLQGLVGGDSVSLTQAGMFADKNAGSNKSVTAAGVLGGADAGNYSLTQPTNLSGSVTPKSVTVTGTVVAEKVYDGSTTATLSGGSVAGLVAGDSVTLNETGAFADKNVGAAKAVIATSALAGSDAGNYSVIQPTNLTGTVAPKAVSVTGTTVADKVYDGSTAATLTGGSLVGIVSGDTVALVEAGNFTDRNFGTAKAVIAANTLAGTDAGNYSVVQPTGLSASVSSRTVTISGTVAATKVYDGSTVATLSGGSVVGLVGGDVVTLTQTGHFADKNVGTAKPITVAGTLEGAAAGNYSISQPTGLAADIAPRSLTVTGLQAQDKVYDGTLAAQVSAQGVQWQGLVTGDQVLVNSVTGNFADRNVGQGKVVAVVASLGGADLGNYTVDVQPQSSAAITPRALSVTADDQRKVYGDADPTLSYRLTGLVAGDTGAATGQLDTATGAQATAGNHAITLGTLKLDANYRITQFVPATLSVDKAPLTLAFDPLTKVYGAAEPTATWTVSASQLKYGDSAAAVQVAGVSTATGAQATAGTHAISGQATAANYAVTVRNGVLTVTQAPLTLTADDKTKTAGEQDPALTWSLDASQLRYQDTAAVVQGAALSAPSGAGTPPGSYAIQISGASAQNYALTLVDGVLTVKPSPAVKSENLQTQVVQTPGDALANPSVTQPVLNAPLPAAGGTAMGPSGSLTVLGGGVAAPAAAPTNAAPAPDAVAAAAPSAPAAAAVDAGSTAAPTAARLVVLQPVTQLQPADIGRGFATDRLFSPPAGAQVTYSATLSDGRPLPAWLRIDAQTGRLEGVPPAGTGALDVQVVAQTSDGQAASARVRLGNAR
ncbi:YDG domain-containing protein [Roseateles sp. LYH14W]|uniref:YDG domain-containing protein n=1 Tax=Pelomonas parva TaxID=3299032 RepID=A0ABW7F3J5_9BURK